VNHWQNVQFWLVLGVAYLAPAALLARARGLPPRAASARPCRAAGWTGDAAARPAPAGVTSARDEAGGMLWSA